MLLVEVSRRAVAPKLNDGPEEAEDGVEGLAAAICEKDIGVSADAEAVGGEERARGG